MRGAVTMLVAFAVFPGLIRSASANCARPVTYRAQETDAGILIEPENFDGRGCPDKEGLVRQNVTTGEVVEIDACAPDAGASSAFLDACVAPGTYRYGFARPYECTPTACSTDYYVEIDVQSAPGCIAPPHAKLPAAPWGYGRTVCTYGGRLARVGLGIVVVVVAFLGAIIFGLVRMFRRRKRPS